MAAVSADPAAGVEAVDAVNIPLVFTLPATVFVAFQLMFAIITVALVSGAVADRIKFGGWLVFAGLWATFVYFPVAHWVFAFDGATAETGGWIANKLKAIDFAGGTAVHINAGTAGWCSPSSWASASVGRHPDAAAQPAVRDARRRSAVVRLVLGFNAGSATASGGLAGSTLSTTTVATAAAMLAWLLTERIRDGHATTLGGAASGIVAGLVAITPSCSAVNVVGALVIGVVAGVLCALAVGLKFKFGFDDSLDVVGVHLVGGILGTLLIGLVATPEAGAGVAGLFYGGGFDQLWRQAVGAGAVFALLGCWYHYLGLDRQVHHRTAA